MKATIISAALGLVLCAPTFGHADLVPVALGASIQSAIDGASDGDTILLTAGVHDENLDFKGKAVTVVGVGPDSVVRGTGSGPVVQFTSGEGPGSVLDSLTITGGLATQGGGIAIVNSSPTIVRTVITANRATSGGSAVFIDGVGDSTAPELRNNLITFNTNAGGDPHSVQIRNAAPLVINNTIFGGDSNAIHLSGNSQATAIMNNVLAYNGSIANGRRGRGICDFSNGGALTQYNVFWGNRIGALLTAGTDFQRIRSAERILGRARLVANYDRAPGFVRRPDRRRPLGDFRLRAASPIRNAGNPAAEFDDRDGTRNDPGYTGGPSAAPR